MRTFVNYGLLLLNIATFPLLSVQETSKLTFISANKIWDKAPHSAFTDLIRFQEGWYCIFRESDQHAGGKDGTISLIKSSDGEVWHNALVFEETGIDLRDPKLSITPDGKLMILMGGSEYAPTGEFITRQSRVAFSSDGEHWSSLTKILEPHEWLWRVTWHEGKAYGVSYRSSSIPENGDWIVTLFVSEDGINYQILTQWDIQGHPSEATLRFLETGEMVALLRRGKNAWIGCSNSPFKDWNWTEASCHLGGPNFLILPDQTMWATGRMFGKNRADEIIERTVLVEMTLQDLKFEMVLPSGGDDTSYPGMVYHNGELWISYYSSHEENKSSIYLAKIKISP